MILVVTSLVSAGYYLPVIMAAYMREPRFGRRARGARLPGPPRAAVAVAIAVVLVFGVLPSAALARRLGQPRHHGADPRAGPSRSRALAVRIARAM